MEMFQSAKDTFYITLRDRIAELNPDRTVTIRDASRPALLVEENEIAWGGRPDPADTFVLRWSEISQDASGDPVLLRGRCEIRYSTAGAAEIAGMDRGRALDRMDAELFAILTPHSVGKRVFRGEAAISTGTRIFWSDAVAGAVRLERDRIARSVLVDVFAWGETV